MVRSRSALLFLCLTAPVGAQDVWDRRDRNEPEMFIKAGGRTATCDALLFSSDGKFLYAGGDDKAIRVWEVSGDDGKLSLPRKMAEPYLRWPAWRDQRGGIKTIAIPADPADKRVAVAGFGLKNGLVVLLDKDGEIQAVNEIEKKPFPNRNVMMASFTPDAKALIYGTDDGTLWFWDFANTNRPIGQHAAVRNAKGEQKPNRIRFIRFLKDDAFLSIAHSGEVMKFTRSGEAWDGQRLFSAVDRANAALKAQGMPEFTTPPETFRADLSADGRWLAVTLQPYYFAVFALEGDATHVAKVEAFVRAVAFGPKNRLAVAKARHARRDGFSLEADDRVDIFDDPTKISANPSVTIPHTFRAEAVAWHPKGWLAIAGGDNHEVTLWDPAKPKAPAFTAVGKGRGLWGVRIGQDGDSIQFQAKRDVNAAHPNQRGQGDWTAFNFVKGQRIEPGQAAAVLTTADGWTVEPSKENYFEWEAVLRNGDQVLARHVLKIDRDRDEAPRCYCFVPKTESRPTRVLLAHYYGFSEFELTDKGAVLTSLRTGHTGDVTAIATDAKGTWAVTTGLDQTVAGWSLAPWASGRIGASFEVQGGKLMVTAVDEYSPAWEMGLTRGSEIYLVVVNGEPKPKYGLPGTYRENTAQPFVLKEAVGDANEAARILTAPEAGMEHYLAWRRPGARRHTENLTTVRRRPLWKFFPSFDANGQFDQWVAWIWKSGHYATSTQGDFLVGWQFNDAETIYKRKPKFFEAEKFRAHLEKRVDVLRLMSTRDLPGTMQKIAGDDPRSMKLGALEPPKPQIVAQSTMLGSDPLTVSIRVETQGTNPDLLPERVELWVNDHRVKDWAGGKRVFNETLQIPTSAFRQGKNQITVLSLNGAGGVGEKFIEVDSDRTDPQPRLLALMVGINDYSKTPAPQNGTRGLGSLTSATNDAQKLAEKLQLHAGKNRLYLQDRTIVTLDQKATPAEVIKALKDLTAEAKPSDRVVIFLAGHGDFVPVPADGNKKAESAFVFCGPDYDRTKPLATSLRGDAVFQALSECAARKVVMIDACHSGQAASDNIVRKLMPTGQGPTVLAACDQSEFSFEDPKLKHGLFTQAVLEALGDKLADADSDSNGQLDPDELYAYVTGRLPRLLRASGKPAYAQNPQAFPVDLPKFAIAKK